MDRLVYEGQHDLVGIREDSRLFTWKKEEKKRVEKKMRLTSGVPLCRGPLLLTRRRLDENEKTHL